MQIFGKVFELKLKKNTDGIAQYDKDYMTIKFEINDNLPTDKTANICLGAVVIRSVFAQNGKYYPQLFLDSALYEL